MWLTIRLSGLIVLGATLAGYALYGMVSDNPVTQIAPGADGVGRLNGWPGIGLGSFLVVSGVIALVFVTRIRAKNRQF